MYIYKTTNLITNLIYIGQSIRNSNESAYYLGSGTRLLEAIKIHGKENFTKEILEDNLSIDVLDAREKFWIKSLKSNDPSIGYNVTSGGSFSSRSELLKNIFSRPDVMEKTKKRNKELWENPDYRKKVTDANIEAWSDPLRLEQHSIRMKEKYSNPCVIENLKESAQNMEKLECPHCKKICKKNHAMSSHFDNCVDHSDPILRDLAIKRRNDRNKDTKKKTCKYCGTEGVVGNINRWHEENCKKKGNLKNSLS